jgi:hypothetical protein
MIQTNGKSGRPADGVALGVGVGVGDGVAGLGEGVAGGDVDGATDAVLGVEEPVGPRHAATRPATSNAASARTGPRGTRPDR